MKQCKDCRSFKPTDGISGKCLKVIGCIGENCNKFNTCKDFESKEQRHIEVPIYSEESNEIIGYRKEYVD